MSNENTIVNQFIKKLGLSDDKKLMDKSNELVRRLDSKSFGSVAKIGDYAKIIICIDLASGLLGLQLENKLVIKLSGLGLSEYTRNKRTFEKILDISQTFDIPKICIQLGVSQVQKCAEKLYNEYKSCVNQINNLQELDLTHPQYAAMAVYQACKKEKVKILKIKLIVLSHLKSHQWEKLEQSWNNTMAKAKLLNVHHKTPDEINLNQEQDNKIQSNTKSSTSGFEMPETYDTYRNKLLRKAYEDLIKTNEIFFIDIHILSVILNLTEDIIETSSQYLRRIRTFLNDEDKMETLDPKYSSMSVYLSFLELNKSPVPVQELISYSGLNSKEWRQLKTLWEENNSVVTNKKNINKTILTDFNVWLESFKRI